MINDNLNIKNQSNRLIRKLEKSTTESITEDVIFTTHNKQTYQVTLTVSKVEMVKKEYTIYEKLIQKGKELLE